MVQDGLKEIDGVIHNTRDYQIFEKKITIYISQIWWSCKATLYLPQKGLPIDVSTCWN